MAAKTEGPRFWDRLIRFLAEAIELSETLSGPERGKEKRRRALGWVEQWYRGSGIRIPYLPGPVERWVVRRIAEGMIDSLVELLKRPALKSGSNAERTLKQPLVDSAL